MKEVIKNNVIYGVGLMGLLYLLIWLEPNTFTNVPLITPLLITIAFICCSCSFDYVFRIWESTKEKGDEQELKRLCTMIDCLLDGRATSLRVYKAKFDDKTFTEKVDFVCWYLEDNHVNFRMQKVNDKKYGKGFEFTIKE